MESERLFSEWRYQEALVAAIREGEGSERTLLHALYRLRLYGLAKEWTPDGMRSSPDLLEAQAWSLWDDGRGGDVLAVAAQLPGSAFERRALESGVLRVPFPFSAPPSDDAPHLGRFLTALWATGRDQEAQEAIAAYRRAHPDDVRGPLFAMRLAVARGEESIFDEPEVKRILDSRHPEAEFLRAAFEERHGDRRRAGVLFASSLKRWPFDYRMLKGVYFSRRSWLPARVARLTLWGSAGIMWRLSRLREAADKQRALNQPGQ